ncbi:I78 family peptidase inhibitor [Lysobacter niabensis]|uniref:I78 family peptidase inhibitor n=1 Tax=Agrilutibacter niabensis TaxID=380628 RepID=UPI0036159911
MRTSALAMAFGWLVLGGGCASTAPTPAVPSGQCQTGTLGWAIGQPATQEVWTRVFKESGAGLWRITTPDQAVPADQRPDRLTIRVDAANNILALECR